MLTKLSVCVQILAMNDRFLKLVVLGFALVTTVHLSTELNWFEINIVFHGYDATGRTFISTFSNNETLLQHCGLSNNITIITHGWEESIRSIWVQAMIGNFSTIRGGCVFFMDYGYGHFEHHNNLLNIKTTTFSFQILQSRFLPIALQQIQIDYRSTN